MTFRWTPDLPAQLSKDGAQQPQSKFSTPYPKPWQVLHQKMSGASGLTVSADGASRRLNPMATDFTPVAKTSSKRKASSSETSVLSDDSTPSNAVYERPSIDASQIFGAVTSPSSDPAEGQDWDDFDEVENAIFGLGGRRSQGGGLRAFGRARRSQHTASLSRGPSSDAQSPAHRPVVLLVQTEAPATSSSSTLRRVAGQFPYLPLCQRGPKSGTREDGSYTVLPSHANRILRASEGTQNTIGAPWPKDGLPVELFELVAAHLARDDVKSMRLVSKEFEQKVCRSLFRTSVVPFNTELYDMIIDEKKASSRLPNANYSGKGKGRASSAASEIDLWAWQNAKEDREGKVYHGHGLRVFKGFGPYIRRFGMSFEILEGSLARPPGKRLLDPVDSYHGTYEWPSVNYARFAKLNRLEETADETSRMKSAFSHLSTVSELGLSMRNGLGWLEGPDRSFRSGLLQGSTSIFGNDRRSKDRQERSAKDVLSCLRQGVQRDVAGANFTEVCLAQHTLDTPLADIQGLKDSCFADTELWPTLDRNLLQAANHSAVRPSADGFKVLSVNTDLASATKLGDLDLNPGELKKDQKEWLLETEWAQRAFLESYILAVVDNPTLFSRVTAMNLATVSSGLLPLIARAAFWDALPLLSSVTIKVSADWRSVHKDEAAYAETKLQNSSDAVRGFHDLVQDQLSWREHIKSLTLGWADGGEHAQGLYARNANLLPAPVSPLQQSTSTTPTGLLHVEHVEHLTLSNCWITPPMLGRLVSLHASLALKKLTLDSVSLTTHPFPSNQAQQAHAAAAAIVNMQAQFQQNNPAIMGGQAPQLPPMMFQQPFAFAQHFQNQMQHMQQIFNPAPAINNNVPANPNAIAPFIPGQVWNPPALGNVNQQVGGGWLLFNPSHQPLQVNTNYWMNDHRQGSWPDLLNKISPGPIFTHHLPAPQPWEEQRPERQPTNLEAIELISCGYARLENNTTFDQSALLAGLTGGHERAQSLWFRTRQLALKPYMLDASNDKYLGRIAQWIPQHELDAMRYAWGLRIGWQDREKAEEAEFDGCAPGGTGRVSGVVEKGMPLMTQQQGVNFTSMGETSEPAVPVDD